MDSNKTAGEEARRQVHKNAASNLEQVPTRHQLYGHLPPITKTIQVRRTRHAGHCWRSRDELISDVLLWTPTHGRAKSGRPAHTFSNYVRSRRPAWGDERLRKVAREGQGYPCYQHDMMIIIIRKEYLKPYSCIQIISILVDLNNAVLGMVSTCLLISKFSNPLTNLLEIVLGAPFTIVPLSPSCSIVFFLFSTNV